VNGYRAAAMMVRYSGIKNWNIFGMDKKERG
jgi:hypothetical protein